MNIPAFIVTLGGLLAWRGAVKWLLGGNTIPISDETFKAIGNSNLPVTVGWALAAVAIAFVLFMAYRRRPIGKGLRPGRGKLWRRAAQSRSSRSAASLRLSG